MKNISGQTVSVPRARSLQPPAHLRQGSRRLARAVGVASPPRRRRPPRRLGRRQEHVQQGVLRVAGRGGVRRAVQSLRLYRASARELGRHQARSGGGGGGVRRGGMMLGEDARRIGSRLGVVTGLEGRQVGGGNWGVRPWYHTKMDRGQKFSHEAWIPILGLCK